MAEIQLKRGGEQSFANLQQISFDFAYFLITTEKYGNDKNDFLQIVSTESCRSLNVDRASDLFGQVIKKYAKLKKICGNSQSFAPPLFNFRHCIYVAIFIILESQSESNDIKTTSYGFKTTSYTHKTASYAFKICKFDSRH